MINWVDKETGEMCRVNYCDLNPEDGLCVVLVMYFGLEQPYMAIWPAQDFFELHEPERMHS